MMKVEQIRVSDGSSESEVEEEAESEVQPGDIVWGLLGRIWYPGKTCTIAEVPDDTKRKFKNISNKNIIKWYGDGMYSLLRKVEKLGETQIDAKRASRSSEMQKLYNTALTDLLQ